MNNQTASTPAEYTKLLGRDNAYVELEATQLTQIPAQVKLLVVKAARLELSEVAHIEALRGIVERFKAGPETKGMSNEQIGFYALRRIFEAGMKSVLAE